MNLYHFIWNVMDLRDLQEIYGNIRKSSMDIVTLFWILVDVDIWWCIWISLEHEWPDPKISWDLLRFSPAHPDPTAPLQRLQRRAVHGGRPGSPQTLLGPGAFSGLGLREHLQTTIVLICFDDRIGWGLSYKWIYDNITIVRGAPYHNFWRQRHDYCIPIIPPSRYSPTAPPSTMAGGHGSLIWPIDFWWNDLQQSGKVKNNSNIWDCECHRFMVILGIVFTWLYHITCCRYNNWQV